VKIALIVPSRERMTLRKNLINSVIETVDDTNNITLYMGVDDDDPTKEEITELSKKHSFMEIVKINNGGKFLGMGKLVNLCSKEVTEDVVGLMGDDSVFITKGWDTKIIEEFKNCPKDNFKMVYVNDGHYGNRIATTPFLHRVYMGINGYLMREEFMGDGGDKWLQRMFFVFGRLKYRKDILVEHRHWLFGKRERDGVTNNLLQFNNPVSNAKQWGALREIRLEEAQRISKKLDIQCDFSSLEDLK